jgi:hypothetical protein
LYSAQQDAKSENKAVIMYSPVQQLSSGVNIMYGIIAECENPLQDQPLVLPRKSNTDLNSFSISLGDKVSVSKWLISVASIVVAGTEIIGLIGTIRVCHRGPHRRTNHLQNNL